MLYCYPTWGPRVRIRILSCLMLVIKISSPSMMILEVERRQRLLYLMMAIKTAVGS
jgi:hypothetical protein